MRGGAWWGRRADSGWRGQGGGEGIHLIPGSRCIYWRLITQQQSHHALDDFIIWFLGVGRVGGRSVTKTRGRRWTIVHTGAGYCVLYAFTSFYFFRTIVLKSSTRVFVHAFSLVSAFLNGHGDVIILFDKLQQKASNTGEQHLISHFLQRLTCNLFIGQYPGICLRIQKCL